MSFCALSFHFIWHLVFERTKRMWSGGSISHNVYLLHYLHQIYLLRWKNKYLTEKWMKRKQNVRKTLTIMLRTFVAFSVAVISDIVLSLHRNSSAIFSLTIPLMKSPLRMANYHSNNNKLGKFHESYQDCVLMCTQQTASSIWCDKYIRRRARVYYIK